MCTDYNQSSEPSTFKLYHIQDQQRSIGDTFFENYDNNNNNTLSASSPPTDVISSPPFTDEQSNFLGLPYHCYNYQDFPALFNMEGSGSGEDNKTWKKRATRKRNLPQKVVRERQLRRNERERARQNRLNDAFDVLRDTIPTFLTPCKKGQKLTQIETLRLAKHYIASLRDVLETQPANNTQWTGEKTSRITTTNNIFTYAEESRSYLNGINNNNVCTPSRMFQFFNVSIINFVL